MANNFNTENFVKLMDQTVDELVVKVEETNLIIDGFLLSQSDLNTANVIRLIKEGDITTTRGAVSAFDRKIASLIKETMDVSFTDGMLEFSTKGADGDDRFRWEYHPSLSASGKSCPDCVGRNGEVKTLEEWEQDGLPGSGITICGGKCNCTLEKEE